ncbi:cobalt-precorrin-6A reductase [Clostridium sp. C8-1-8]|uniref:cobalt-precorrin-6A reductase n=1 Tax=Clostridium sp. C8-1-8 TaxID=2698831 RepID=UPI00136F7BFA|nr:cobalt-precorrin-6A reductase [Clostridium sp. C8-1-8]
MIALILGTSEGKKILSLLNQFTENIVVSTATSYGGELLKDYKYRLLNTKPLDYGELKSFLLENNIKTLVDASHPYAQVVTENAVKACEALNIEYLRYERPSVADKYKDKIVSVKDYEELYVELSKIDGAILNTTGSNNINKFISMKLKSRVIHRVLPSVKVMEKCFELGLKTEDIIAIKGPISYELNLAFIDEYSAKAMVVKDSGAEGGTEEKIRAAIDRGVKIFLIERAETKYKNTFDHIEALVNYVGRRFY